MQVLGAQVKNTFALVSMITRMSDHRRLVWSGHGQAQWLQFSANDNQFLVNSKIGDYGTKYIITMSCMHRITFANNIRLVPEAAETIGIIDNNLDGYATSFPPRHLHALQRQIGDSDFYKLLFAALTARLRPETDVEYYEIHAQHGAMSEPLREAWRIVQPALLGILRQVVVPSDLSGVLSKAMEQFPGSEESDVIVTLTTDDVAINGTFRISVPDPLAWFNIAVVDVEQVQLRYAYEGDASSTPSE